MNGNRNVQFFGERIIGLDLRIVRCDSRILEHELAKDLEASLRMKLAQLSNRWQVAEAEHDPRNNPVRRMLAKVLHPVGGTASDSEDIAPPQDRQALVAKFRVSLWRLESPLALWIAREVMEKRGDRFSGIPDGPLVKRSADVTAWLPIPVSGQRMKM